MVPPGRQHRDVTHIARADDAKGRKATVPAAPRRSPATDDVRVRTVQRDSIERLHSLAGNAAVAGLLSAPDLTPSGASPPIAQRDEGSRQTTLDDIDPAKVDAAIAGLIGIVRGNFTSAVNNARTSLIRKSIDEATKKTLFQNLTIAVGTMFLPGVLNFVSSVVQDTLRQTLPGLVKAPNFASDMHILITEQFTPSKISSYTSSAQSILTSKNFDIYGNDKYARTFSYLENLDDANAQIMTASALSTLTRGRADSITLLGLLSYLAAHNEIYREDVLTRATHFMTEIADVIVRDELSGSIVGPQLCKIAAYGRDRWARVQVGALDGWSFLQWVDPDAAEVLDRQFAGKPSVPRLSPEEIAGHLPDPVLESGGQRTPGGQPMRTEWTNAWGGLRLVEVDVPEHMQGSGEYVFRRWIPSAEKDAAQSRGQLQIGGLDPGRPIDPDKIRGKVAPNEGPLL